MSYPSTPPYAARIDIVDHVGRAYRLVIDNARFAGEMALLPYLIVFATELIAWLITDGGWFGRLLAALIHAIGFLVFGTVFLVRWHRFVLLGESVGQGLIPPGWTEFVVTAVKLGAIALAGWVVLVFIVITPPHFLTVPLAGIGGVALTLFALRVSLIFPAAAIGRPVALRTAWYWVTGNFWRFFACAFACYFPFIIVQVALSSIAAYFPSFLGIVFEGLRLAISFAGTAVVATLLSHLYREIVLEPG